MKRTKEIKEFNVIDLILLDHKYVKECIEILKDEDADKRKKLSYGKGFLDALKKHSLAEKKAVYAPLEKNDELHFNILEAEIEHGIVDQKVKLLKPKVTRMKKLTDEMAAELKVLAELVEHHIKEEESEMLPKMRAECDEDDLSEMGLAFMKLRKFTPKELQENPQLSDELVHWKDSVQEISSRFLTKMDKYVENLRH